MSRLNDIELKGTTAADGTLTVDDNNVVFGLLYAIEWIDGTFDDATAAVISCQLTGSGVANTLLTLSNPDANADKMYYPRDVVHSLAGAALTGTAGGDRCLPLVNGTLRMAVTAGGNAKTGGCIVYVLED